MAGIDPLQGDDDPITRAIGTFGDRWTLLIIREAMRGTRRFGEFAADLGIADSVLAGRLSRLVDLGILATATYHDRGRARQEYRLTRAGADLAPVLRALARWGTHHTRPATPTLPMRFLHDECGQDLTDADYCVHCRVAVPREHQLWTSPWRAEAPYHLAEAVPPSDEE